MDATLSLESVWKMAQSLSPAGQQLLVDRLNGQMAVRALGPYTMEEINARIDQFEAELEAGEKGYTLEEFDSLVKERYKWVG